MAQSRNSLRDPEKEVYWRQKLLEWKRSGLSQAEFCRREGLNQNTFSSWKTIIPERDAEQRIKDRSERVAAKEKPSFIRVEVDTKGSAKVNKPAQDNSKMKTAERPPERTVAAELIDAKIGYRVRIFNGADVSTLTAIVNALTSHSSKTCEF